MPPYRIALHVTRADYSNVACHFQVNTLSHLAEYTGGSSLLYARVWADEQSYSTSVIVPCVGGRPGCFW